MSCGVGLESLGLPEKELLSEMAGVWSGEQAV